MMTLQLTPAVKSRPGFVFKKPQFGAIDASMIEREMGYVVDMNTPEMTRRSPDKIFTDAVRVLQHGDQPTVVNALVRAIEQLPNHPDGFTGALYGLALHVAETPADAQRLMDAFITHNDSVSPLPRDNARAGIVTFMQLFATDAQYLCGRTADDMTRKLGLFQRTR